MDDKTLSDVSGDGSISSSKNDKESLPEEKKELPTDSDRDYSQHVCNETAACIECRKKYDHDFISSKYFGVKNKLAGFISGKFSKKTDCLLSEDVVSESSHNSNYRVRLFSSILSFSSRYHTLPLFRKIIVLLFASFFAGLFGAIFVQNTGLYMSGLAGTSQGIARLVRSFLSAEYEWVYNLLFWLLIVLINIPLFFFGYYKISKEFAILTAVYVTFANLFGFIFSNIPGVSDFVLIGSNIDRKTPFSWTENGGQLFGLFFSGLVYGQLMAVVYMFIFAVNGSSGGFDFFSVWYSRKKHKSIAKIFTIVSCVSMFFGTVLGGYVVQCTTENKLSQINQYMFTPNLLTSLMMVILQGITLNLLFPRFKWVKVEIYNNKCDEIRNILMSDPHPHAVSICEIVGGYSLKPKKIISTICLYFEIPRLLALVRYVDKNCLVSISDVKSLDGYVYMYDASTRGKWYTWRKRKKTIH